MTRTLRLPVLALALAAAGLAHADDKRLEQTREALRRAQAALQSTQSQRDALAQEKARLEQDRQGADAAVAKAQASAHEASARNARSEAGLAQASAERDKLRGELEAEHAEREKLQKALEQMQAQVAEAQSRAADQRRTTQALGGLLQRSVQSLADNEKQNLALYELGTRTMDAYRRCELHGSGAVDAGAPGLFDVKLENRSEQLRKEMDALATPATAAATAGATATR